MAPFFCSFYSVRLVSFFIKPFTTPRTNSYICKLPAYFLLQANTVSSTRDIATRVVATRDLDYKVGHVTGHKDPEGEYKYGCTLSLTSALDVVGGQHHNPAALPSGKRLVTHCTVS